MTKEDEMPAEEPEELPEEDERDMTIGELYDIHEELSELEEQNQKRRQRSVARTFQRRRSVFRRKGKHGEDREREEAERLERIAGDGGKERGRTAGKAARRGRTPGRRAIGRGSKACGSIAARRRRAHMAANKHARTAQSSAAEDFEPVIKHEDAEEDLGVGEVNPYTGREYQTNSVRMHPSRIGYVQVYDRSHHKWTDMTEWAFPWDIRRGKKHCLERITNRRSIWTRCG